MKVKCTKFQGGTETAADGTDCPAVSPGDDSDEGGWLCTLPAGHKGPHEAWGFSEDRPYYIWGTP